MRARNNPFTICLSTQTIVVRDNDKPLSTAERSFASAIAFAGDEDENRSLQSYETHQAEVAPPPPSNANVEEEQVSTASLRQADRDQSSEETHAKGKTSGKDEAKAANGDKHAESYAPASMNNDTMIKSHENERFRPDHEDGDSDDDDEEDHNKSKSNDDHEIEA